MIPSKNTNIIDHKIIIPEGFGSLSTKSLLFFKRGLSIKNKQIYSFSKRFEILKYIKQKT